MSRPKRSHSSGKETAKIPVGLSAAPYSSKVGGNKYVVYVDYHPENEDHPRVIVYSFLATYAAKWFVNRIIGDDEYEMGHWKFHESDVILTTSKGIQIRMCGNLLEEVLSYEFKTEEEEEWKDEGLARSVAHLKWGKWEHKPANTNIIETEDGPQEVKLTRREMKKAERAMRREEKNKKREANPEKVKKPKKDMSGMITAGELAEQMGILARDFRAALRKLAMIKPSYGWAWAESDAEKIKKQVKGALK